LSDSSEYRSGDDSYYPRLSPWSVGLRGTCPRCGRGALFDGFLQVAERCDHCGLDLKKADSGDGPAIFIIFIMGFLVVPLALLVESWFGLPLWLHTIIWSIVIVGGSLALLRPMKGVMIALQYRNRASDSGTVDYDDD
jgi:uncharacterized protein (DUF983 family)